MRSLGWLAWHAARFHRLTVGRPYDAPIGWTARCRCGHNRRIY